MPVGTRSTFGRIGTGGLAQPAGMVADSRSRSTVTGQNENKSGNEQQQNEEGNREFLQQQVRCMTFGHEP